MRKYYFVSYVYGQGDLWAFVEADSAESIRSRYPKLEVYEDRPDDVSEARYAELWASGPDRFGRLEDDDFWILRAMRGRGG